MRLRLINLETRVASFIRHTPRFNHYIKRSLKNRNYCAAFKFHGKEDLWLYDPSNSISLGDIRLELVDKLGDLTNFII